MQERTVTVRQMHNRVNAEVNRERQTGDRKVRIAYQRCAALFIVSPLVWYGVFHLAGLC